MTTPVFLTANVDDPHSHSALQDLDVPGDHPWAATKEEVVDSTFRRPQAIVIRGHSWAAEVMTDGQLVNNNLDSWWPQMLRKRLGYSDFRYTVPGTDTLINGVGYTRQVGRANFPQIEGQVCSVYAWWRDDVTGQTVHYRVVKVYTNRGISVVGEGMAGIDNQDETWLANTKVHLPFLALHRMESLRVTPGDGFVVENIPTTQNVLGPLDNGFLVTLIINGGEYSNHARNASMMCQPGLMMGGWGELDAWETLRIRGAGAPITAYSGFFDVAKASSHLPIYTSPQNDWGAGADEAMIKETYRFCWSMEKSLLRNVANDVTITSNNGDGGGVWTTRGPVAPAPSTGALDTLKYYDGTIGATKPYFEIALPATYRAFTPVAIHMMSTPARTVSGCTTTNGSTTLNAPAGTLYDMDDLNLPISGTNIQPGTTIIAVAPFGVSCTLSLPATGTGTTSVIIGFGGANCTISIKVGAGAFSPPNFAAGVRINNTSVATFSTSMLSGFNGNGRVGLNRTEPGANTACRIFPCTRVISGLPNNGAHIIRVTLDSYPHATGFNRFWQNGYSLESIAPSPPIIMMRQPVLMATSSTYARVMHGATGRVNVATLNGILDDLAAEFSATARGNIFFVPMDEVLDENAAYFSDASHMSPLGHKLAEQAVWDTMQTIPADVLAAS